MKLEVGMYCRTQDGYIFKYSKKDNIEFHEKNNTYYLFIDNGEYSDCYAIKKIDNSIISLIEVGDYVNGFPVEDYFREYNEEKDIFENIGVVTTECYLEDVNFSWILEKDIKTILTKESFENNCYKIGE